MIQPSTEHLTLHRHNQEQIISTLITARPRLLAILQRKILPQVVVIVAPAGYGKTTLANQWADFLAIQTARLSLTNEHNTPDRFLRGLMSAFDIAWNTSSTLDSALEEIARQTSDPSRRLLIVDDYHVIESREVHQMMSVILARLPAGIQLVLISRTTPTLPLARRRMHGDVLDISVQDLAFTKAEVMALVSSEASASTIYTHRAEDIEELASRTGGWIAGIRLAMAGANGANPSRSASIVDTWFTRQSLDDFVLEEVLSGLSEELNDFVLRTAFLPHLEPALCDYVLGIDNSPALIDEASRQLVFIRPESSSSTALIYHALFAESADRISLRHHSLEDRKSRYTRAAEWFELQGKEEEALELALRAQDWETAIRTARRVCGALRDRDLSASRLYWLRKIPLEHLLKHADLTRWYTSALLETGRVTEANQILKQVLPMWEESGDDHLQAYIHASKSFTAVLQGDEGAVLHHLYSALHYQSIHDPLERLHIWSAVMSQEFHRGNDIVADQAYLQIQHCRQHLPAEQGWMFNHVELMRTNQLAHRGHLADAVIRHQSQMKRLPAIFQHAKPNMQCRLAAIYLEQNELEMALDMAIDVERGLDIYPQHLWHIEAWLIVARIHHALNDLSRAENAIHRARLIQDQSGGWTMLVKIMATEAWFRFNNCTKSQIIDSSLGISLNQPWRTAFTGELDPRIVEIALLVLQGNAIAAAAPLQALIDDAIATQRWAELVQLATWQAVVHLELDDQQGAIEALKLALHHGRPGGFVRSFHTPGYDLVPFLRSALPLLDDQDAAYVNNLIQSGISSAVHTSLQEQLSPLTRQEQTVLELLAHGSSNKVIAEHLFITERTVKKHVSNILHKLRVKNRTSAVAHARKLGLIP